MINSKKIYNQLLNDDRITSIINEDSIFDAYPNEIEVFPCIVFIDGNQNNLEYADNKYYATGINVDIHIFTKTLENYPTTTEIGMVIAEVFEENGFTSTMNTELTDVQVDVKHRIMSFKREILVK